MNVHKVLTITIISFLSLHIAGQTIKVKPYLQDATPSSIIVSWETNSGTESTLEWGTTNALGNVLSGTSFNATDGVSRMHEVELSSLSAATKYYYRVQTGTAVSAVYNFKTPPSPESNTSFTFAAMSDMQNDAANPNKYYEICHDGILDYYNAHFSGDLSDNLAMLLITGDLVDSGTTYSQWEQTYFTPSHDLLQYVPNYPVLGNHENNSPNYFNYFHLPSNGPSGYIEHAWYKDYSNVRFIGMDTNYQVINYQTQTQLDWLTTVLNDAAANTHLDFVVLQVHHPYKSELWTPGEVAYSGQIIYRLDQFTNTSGKPSLNLFGHTHGYSHGHSRDYKHIWMDVATAGGNIDYWNEYPNYDYPEFSVTHDEYGFVVFEVTAGDNPKIVAKRISRGNESTPKDNVMTDTFTIYKNPKQVNTPTPEFPVNQSVSLACLEFKASDFSSPEQGAEHGQTQWQVNTTNDFSDPQYDSWKNFENWYNHVNTQANDDLTNETILGLQPNITYWWRVRYRDKELNWSDWSIPVSFTTAQSAFSSNLLQNPGAESGMDHWSIEEGVVESLNNGQCGSPSPYAGVKLFAAGGICTDTPVGRATQMVDVSSYASLIDMGNYQAYFGGYMRDWDSKDIPQVKIYCYNASNVLLSSSNWLTHNTPTWTLKENSMSIPINTRFIKFEMKGVRNNGSDNDSYLDALFLKTIDCPGLSIHSYKNSKINVFPNPLRDSSIIQFKDTDINLEKIEILLTDILGKTIKPNFEVIDSQIVMFRNEITSGVYIIQVIENNKIIEKIKLIVQ